MIIFNISLKGNTQTTLDNFYESFDEKYKILIILLFVIVTLLLIASFYLLKNIIKIKAQNHEISKYDEFRKAFIDSSEHLIYLKDEKLKYVFVNKALEKFYERRESEIIGSEDYDLSVKEFAERRRETDIDVLGKKIVVIDEIKWENKVYKTIKFPVKLSNNHYGIGAYIEDVTEEYNKKRKIEEINETLNKSNILLSAIFESSPEIIVFSLDNNYCYMTFNKRHKETMKDIWGKDIEIGMSMLEVIGSHNDRLKSKENFDRVFLGESFSLIEDYGCENLYRYTWENYYAPIYSSNSKIIGLTCFAINISNRIKAEEKIAYLSYHDPVTDLYNQTFMYEELKRLDIERNLPFSVIVGDVNGLKLTNDIFGHEAGDILLKKISDAIKISCRADEIIARVGGDEFIILLPKTNSRETDVIINRIYDEVEKVEYKSIRGSIALGKATKTKAVDDFKEILKEADEVMYLNKNLSQKVGQIHQLHNIIETFHIKSERERIHSQNVSELCEKIAIKLDLANEKVRRIRDAGFYHDIGKVILEDHVLGNLGTLNEDEQLLMRKHPATGYRILNIFDGTMDIAKGALEHHEHWDGSGYPKGLEKDEISLLGRIVAVAEAYDFRTNPYSKSILSKAETIIEIRKNAGIKYDPKVVDAFLEVIEKQS